MTLLHIQCLWRLRLKRAKQSCSAQGWWCIGVRGQDTLHLVPAWPATALFCLIRTLNLSIFPEIYSSAKRKTQKSKETEYKNLSLAMVNLVNESFLATFRYLCSLEGRKYILLYKNKPVNLLKFRNEVVASFSHRWLPLIRLAA